jgi:tetratricopeptide (TPR) repeat protein
MIVKNEMANIERCLTAVAPYISAWVIGDTGSTDGTQRFIEEFFAAKGIHGELHSFPFENFGQARNEGLKRAYASKLKFDYLLLDDADMELVVDVAGFQQHLDAPGYQLMQLSTGGLRYWNTRLLRRDAGAWYHGVTHEYLDVPGGTQKLSGVWYRDHASGSNRVDKFERDIRLLKKGLKNEPDNARYWFYLAQSYQDAGRPQEAAKTYRKRAEMGGWVEEVWTSKLRMARNLLKAGDETGFVAGALEAFQERPSRAEPLYDLARHYRLKGQNELSAMFAERGLEIPPPEQDILFIEDWVYRQGLREEFSIAANYSKNKHRKGRGFDMCDSLALDPSIGSRTRDLAASNLQFYVEGAAELLPSIQKHPVTFTAPHGYVPMNPSIARVGNELLMVQRCVNYEITNRGAPYEEQRYETRNNEPVNTRNFLLTLEDDLSVRNATEIKLPPSWPVAQWSLVSGIEDMRLFDWNRELWVVGTVREQNSQGLCEQTLLRLESSDSEEINAADWRVLMPEGEARHEKNWMPFVEGDELRFLYSCDPTRVLNEHGKTIVETEPSLFGKAFRGGSQLVRFDDGWLALVHQVEYPQAKREYWHRFVWLDDSLRLRKVSRPFYFNERGVEFVAGLALASDDETLVISYGVNDSESWLARVTNSDVRASLRSVDSIPSGFLQAPDLGKLAVSEPKVRSRESRRALIRNPRNPAEAFLTLAPFLVHTDSPTQRRTASRAFDAPIAKQLDLTAASLPQIHCYYEVVGEGRRHDALTAAVSSMRAAGHPVRLWSYTPERLKFLERFSVELSQAANVVPRSVFDKIVADTEIRFFSDVFRYAVLYQHGGLWMDGDVVLLRPFPYVGDHFFNLQWRPGSRNEHFICGNVIFARRHSPHLKALYEQSLELFASGRGRNFGDVGPKLLSEYVISKQGRSLLDSVFSPMFFNSLDWTESELFRKPIDQLGDFIGDERVFGLHMWAGRHDSNDREGRTFIGRLFEWPKFFRRLSDLAEQFETDRNRRTGNKHGYARHYEEIIGDRRLSLRKLLEIMQVDRERQLASAELWQNYFPFAEITSAGKESLGRKTGNRIHSVTFEQSEDGALTKLRKKIGPEKFEVIIDDGTHASDAQQATLKALFPLLEDGGWYFIEDLDWQPPGEDRSKTLPTKELLAHLNDGTGAATPDPYEIAKLKAQIERIVFFDSDYELNRAGHVRGLAAIQKRGGSGFV